MKAGIFYAALSLSALAAAQPHGRHHHQHARRDVVHETVVVTATVPNVIVYVDQDGVPFATSFADVPAPTEAPAAAPPAPAPAPSDVGVIAAEAPKPVAPEAAPVPAPSAPAPPAPPAEPAPAPAASSPAAPAPPPSPPAEEVSGYGISYAPYTDNEQCKTQDQVNKDVTQMKGYNVIRTYGTDCEQVSKLLKAPKPSGVKLFLGIWDIAQVEKEAKIIIDAVAGDWGKIDTISVGNELVNKGAASAGAVAGAVNAARSKLRAAGYNGPVVTVDTFNAIIANPELCGASDYAAANCHAFFDPNTEASQAGDFVLGMAQRVSQACGGKKTVITETGWPSEGSANSKAVPGVSQHMAAIDSIKSKFSSNVIFFSAFNDGWKKDFPGSFGAEKFWGMIQ